MDPSREPPPRRPAPPNETTDGRIRRAIDEAAEQGFFENLPGSGKPLDLSDEDNPFIPDDMRLAYRILRNAGYSLPWIELRKEIEAQTVRLERAVAAYPEVLRATLGNIQHLPAYRRAQRLARVKTQHQEAVARHANTIDELNRKIDDFNLSVPVESLQLRRVNRPAALAALEAALPSSLA